MNTYKIACGKRVLFTYIAQTVAISFECLPVFLQNIRHEDILQLARYLSFCNKYMYKHNMFSKCDFVFMQQNSYSDKVSLYI